MAQAYQAPQLCNHYCARLCPLGIKTITPCELRQIDRLTVTVLAAMRSAGDVQETILDVGADGHVTRDELPRLKKAMKQLEAMERASMELRLVSSTSGCSRSLALCRWIKSTLLRSANGRTRCFPRSTRTAAGRMLPPTCGRSTAGFLRSSTMR